MMLLVLLLALGFFYILHSIQIKEKAKKRANHVKVRAELIAKTEVQALLIKKREDDLLEIVRNLPPQKAYERDGSYHGRIVNRGQSNPIIIQYHSGGGEITTRKIIMHSLKATMHSDNTITPIYVESFCHFRKEERTFYIDAIRAAVDINTGERIDDIPTYIVQAFGRYNIIRRKNL